MKCFSMYFSTYFADSRLTSKSFIHFKFMVVRDVDCCTISFECDYLGFLILCLKTLWSDVHKLKTKSCKKL